MSRGPAVVRRIHPGAWLHMGLLALALLPLLPGCATVPLDTGGGGPGPLPLPLVQGRVVEVDGFEELLLGAGLDDTDLLPAREAELTPEDAAELYDRLLARPITLARFGTRLAASFLLREIMEAEEELSRPALLSRVKRFEHLAVLRPDGYLAWVLSGHTQQYVGQVVLSDGALKAGPFEVGRFYDGRSGAFFPVDEQLRRIASAPPLAEVYSDADLINRSFDGAEDAFRDTVLALGELVLHPGDSLSALSRLPQGVAALILHCPEYQERFRLMTRGEQIRALSRLTVTVLATYGAAAGTTRTLTTMGSGLKALSVPTLSLSADGVLMLNRVAVPTGRIMTALGGGPGAAIVLHMANASGQGPGVKTGQPAQPTGPGQWQPVKESMSRRAARYQEQISGRTVDESYITQGVRFDGFKDGVLLEAKGPGYANKFNKDLSPKRWFAKGAQNLLKQARRQLSAANGNPIRWHVAETKAAEAIRKLLTKEHFHQIEVVCTAAIL